MIAYLAPIALAIIAFTSGYLSGSAHAVKWCIELYWDQPAREHAAKHGFSEEA